jgi:hypothetical protein
VSVAEDAVAVGSTSLMTFFPFVFLGLLVPVLIGTAWLAPRIARAVRRRLALLRGCPWFGPQTRARGHCLGKEERSHFLRREGGRAMNADRWWACVFSYGVAVLVAVST